MMKVTYIHHSCFLVETCRFYYLFDYEKGSLPEMDVKKPIFVLSSHGHGDHYNGQIFSMLADLGMEQIHGVLSDDIPVPEGIQTQQVAPNGEYVLGEGVHLTTLRSTDLGVAFLIEDQQKRIYHAGDLNDWVWEEETQEYNTQMTADYQFQINLLADKLEGKTLDAAFVVLDPRQEADYARGICYFLEHIPAKKIYPMHYWGKPEIIQTFLRAYPQYSDRIQRTEISY